ncbi:MAG: amidase [Lautropia sp.]
MQDGAVEGSERLARRHAAWHDKGCCDASIARPSRYPPSAVTVLASGQRPSQAGDGPSVRDVACNNRGPPLVAEATEMDDLCFQPITRLSDAIDRGEVDVQALTHLFLDRVKARDASINSYVLLLPDAARAEARAAAARAARKQRLSAIDGIPIALKDNIDVAGVHTSNGFGGQPCSVATEDAEVVRRLRAAGAVILGKLNMHEGALGALTDNPHFGRTNNPHRDGHSPGGSSGGSGAAVAAGLCCAAIGTDTGGSVRIPASYCGVVGLKPSYGLVSTRGVVPLSRALDHVGPLTRTVADAALLLDALAGFDARCTESRRGPSGFGIPSARRLDGLRVGIIDEFAAEPTEPAIGAAFEAAVEHFARLGSEIHQLRMPTYDMRAGRRACFVRVEVEAAVEHGALYHREPQRFSTPMRSYLDYGAKVSATRLVEVDHIMQTAAFELARCLEQVDVVISPTTPQAAPRFDGLAPDSAGTFCGPANFSGFPAISVPMGRDPLGLPLGLQMMCALHQDARLLQIAAAFEAALGLRLTPP